jgi:hypothetical protein
MKFIKNQIHEKIGADMNIRDLFHFETAKKELRLYLIPKVGNFTIGVQDKSFDLRNED